MATTTMSCDAPSGGGIMLVVSAPSGTGKGTVIGELRRQNPDIALSVSVTSREPRDDEQDGVHYHFVTKARFEEMIQAGSFVEWDEYQGNYYGTSKEKTAEALMGGHDLVFDITIKGAFAMRRYYPGAATLVFLLPPSFAELERRLRSRGSESDEKILGRLAEARREIVHLGDFDYNVVNDDVGAAARRLDAILTAAKCRTRDPGAIIQRVISG